MAFRIPRTFSLPSPSPFCNHRIGNSGVAIYLNRGNLVLHPSPLSIHRIYSDADPHYLNVCIRFLSHSFSIWFSYFHYYLLIVIMASMPLSPGADARIIVPSPLWWQPCTRWVAITHLPPRLHTHSTVASLVAYFGSLVSFSYPAHCEDKRIVLALVANCFITKIPHIMPVKDGDRVFPVRVQIIFQTKIGKKGIIFDPLDLGDAFCNFYSQGQCPSASQQGVTFSLLPTTRSLALVRDKKKHTSASTAINMPPPPPVRANSSLSSGSLLKDSMMVSSFRDSKTQNLAYMEQALTSAIHKFNLEADGNSRDSDNTEHEVSHQSYLKLLTAEVGKHSDETSVMKRIEDKGKTKRMHEIDADSSTVKSSPRVDWAPPPMYFPSQVKPASSESSVKTNLQENDPHCSTAQSQLNFFKPGTLLKSAKDPGTAVREKKGTAWGIVSSQKWASPPIIFKRRRVSKLEGQGKDGVVIKSSQSLKIQNGNFSSLQDVSRGVEGEVSDNLGMSTLR